MNDSISRQKVIDWLKNEWDGMVTSLFNGIESLPSAQPERKTGKRWILFSERLSETNEFVLATTAWGEVTIAQRFHPSVNSTYWFIHEGNTNATVDDLIAWMPLPDPYQPDDFAQHMNNPED